MNSELLKVYNEKQDEINKLRTENSKLLIENIIYKSKLKGVIEYIEYIIGEPVSKSYHQTLTEIKEIIEGEPDE